MPIKGLSEKRRLPRLGKIHLGTRHPEKGYPIKTDYFVCPSEVQEVFGEKPKELRILIPLEDEEKWCSQYYRCYSKTRGLICKGDGETALRMVDTQSGAMADRDSKTVEMKEIPCQGRECPDYKTKCKEVMNLQFLLPEVPGLGIWQIDTSSINSIRNINSSAELIKAVYGRIQMVPLLLTLEPKEVNNPDTGKKQMVYVLNLKTNATLIELMQATSRPYAEMLTGAVALPAPDDERPDLISPEFEPDPVEMPEGYHRPTAKEALEELWPEDKSKTSTKQPQPSPEVLQPVTEAPEEETGVAIPDVPEPEPEKKDERPVTKDDITQLKEVMSENGYGMTELGALITNELKFKGIVKLTDLNKWQLEEIVKHIKKG